MTHRISTSSRMCRWRFVSGCGGWHSMCVDGRLMIRFLFSATFSAASAPLPQDGEILKDWVFINYTFKRFEGLTQRGTPTKK